MKRDHPKSFDPLKKKFGWVPGRQDESLAIASALPYPTYGDLPRIARAKLDQKDTFIWLAKNQIQPKWWRGQQGIGDCVSWGAELGVTMILWQQAVLGISPWEAEASTEAIYGGCRVEANGGRSPLGNEDGAIGAWAVKWLLDWGVLLRKDYGGGDLDLTKYSAKKAKDWGTSGCGGRADKGKLDGIAKEHPVEDATLCKTTQDVTDALLRGCPVTTASMVGYGNMKRDKNGICNPSDEWAHQMMFGGVRFLNGQPNYRLFQSWDDMDCSGPDPGIDDDAISDCSWWITEKALQHHLRDEDTFALSRVKGFDLPAFNLATGLFI